MYYNIYMSFEPKKWTIGAVRCYQRGCRCKGCFINQTYKDTLGGKCAMKLSVRKLVEKFGLPDDIKLQEILQEDE